MEILVRAEIDFDSLDYLCIDDFDGNKYLIGVGFVHNNTHIVLENGDQFPIKKDTRSINLSDMLDSQGNKIFASLSEDGKGGDILTNPNSEKLNGLNEFVAIYNKWNLTGLWLDGSGVFGFRLAFNNKVIGIQE